MSTPVQTQTVEELGGRDVPPSPPPRVVVRNLSKTYHTRRGSVRALDNVSLDVQPGEILVLLGPSGCGKTTLLRCIAGLEQPDAGEIMVHGNMVFSSAGGVSLPPEARELSMVFQSYALWPHMTVFDNIAYPLRNAGHKKPDVQERTRTVLHVVGLDDYSQAYPGQLSGGQQQRVALARAIVANDGLVLFDEPLSNLDAKVRERLRVELLALHADIHFSAVYVTHDQTEATALGDRIAVMDVGVIAQIGTPPDIYYRPGSRYVAQFIGSANEIPGVLRGWEGERCRVETPVGDILGTPGGSGLPAVGDQVLVLFRPEHCRVLDGRASPGLNQLSCRVERSMFLGSHVDYVVAVESSSIILRSIEGELLPSGSELTVGLDPERARVFPA